MSTIPGLPLSGSVRVLIAAKPVDFRKGAGGLAALAKEVLAQDPFSGAIIVFRAKRADRVKISGLGRQRPGAGLEALGGRSVQMASHHGRRDAAVAGAVGCANRGARLDARACA